MADCAAMTNLAPMTMNRRPNISLIAFIIGILIANGVAQTSPRTQETRAERSADRRAADMIKDWQEKPREAAEAMLQRYGEPQEVTHRRLIWHNNGPWKRTTVINEEIDHDFPKPHKDCLEQVIAYRVPVEKFSDLAAFDGSVIAERTRGELAARCDKEPMNFLAINLAHDVATGKVSVKEARSQYAQTAMQFMKGDKPPYTQDIQFERPVNDRMGDPGEAMLMEAMKGLFN